MGGKSTIFGNVTKNGYVYVAIFGNVTKNGYVTKMTTVCPTGILTIYPNCKLASNPAQATVAQLGLIFIRIG